MAFTTAGVVLYHPDHVLDRRVISLDDLASYTRSVQTACGEFFTKNPSADVLDVVVVVKPRSKARAWIITRNGGSSPDALRRLEKLIDSLPAPAVREGPVAFAILGTTGGVKRELPPADGYKPPMPDEWRAAAAKLTSPGIVPDSLLEIIWPG